MESVIVLDQNNRNINIDVVRYFKSNATNYLIYTLNERDEAGYVKVYASKVSEVFVAEKIADDNEWNNIKDLIKVIVKEAKESNLTTVEDLNLKELSNLKLFSSRVFKLANNVTEMLGANKKVFAEQPIQTMSSLEDLLGAPLIETPTVVSTPVVPVYEAPKEETPIVVSAPVVPLYGMPVDEAPTTDFEKLYLVEKEKVDQLTLVIDELTAQNSSYQAKIDQVTNDMSIKLAEYQTKLEQSSDDANMQCSIDQDKLNKIREILK